jgi:hypothetical protein
MKGFKLFIASALCSVLVASAQLPAPDERLLGQLEKRLQLESSQMLAIRGLYERVQTRVDSLDAEIQHLLTTEENEDRVTFMVPVLQQRKKDEKDLRELRMREILTAGQRVIYDSEIKPVKPLVLHFGIHDRMDCNVCNK